MSRTRIYLLIPTLLFALQLSAQQRFQKGSVLAHVSANASVDGLGAGVTNAGFTVADGGSYFFRDNLAVTMDGRYSWAPLTQNMSATVRLQSAPFDFSATSHSLLLDVHGGLGQTLNTTIGGDMFGRTMSAVGVGAQYAYWLTPRASLYLWPQLKYTNGGASGLWGWQMIAPLGLQIRL